MAPEVVTDGKNDKTEKNDQEHSSMVHFVLCCSPECKHHSGLTVQLSVLITVYPSLPSHPTS